VVAVDITAPCIVVVTGACIMETCIVAVIAEACIAVQCTTGAVAGVMSVVVMDTTTHMHDAFGTAVGLSTASDPAGGGRITTTSLFGSAAERLCAVSFFGTGPPLQTLDCREKAITGNQTSNDSPR
jgi:hypothetical protein